MTRLATLRRRGLLANLLLLGVAGVLGLLAAELLTRLALRDVTTTRDNTSWFARRWHREHPPIQNAGGFRERDFAPRPAPGVVRIAVVGDSFAWGQGLPEADRFSDRLQARLGPRFEILNFARPGANTEEHVEILHEAVLPAHPDYVLLQWYLNDVEGRTYRTRPQPRRLIPSDRISGWLHERSALYYLVNQQWQSLQATLGWTRDHVSLVHRRFGDPEGPPAAAARAALVRFLRACRDAGIPAAIVLFPHVDEAGLREDRLGFLLDRVVDTCAAERVPCIDLRRVLLPAARGNSLWVNRLDAHPGARAHALAADAITGRLAPIWHEIAQRKQESDDPRGTPVARASELAGPALSEQRVEARREAE